MVRSQCPPKTTIVSHERAALNAFAAIHPHHPHTVPGCQDEWRISAVVSFVQWRPIEDVLPNPIVIAIDAVTPNVGLLGNEFAGQQVKGHYDRVSEVDEIIGNRSRLG